MFKRAEQPPAPERRVSDVARIQGGGLVQVIVTHLNPIRFFVFVNHEEVPQQEVETFLISVEAPAEGSRAAPRVHASLSRYVTGVSGQREARQFSLFPGTIEVIALGRRLCVTARQADSLEGLWIDLGLRPDGTGHEVSGARALQVLITSEFLDARLTWMDGSSEDILPHLASLEA